MSKLDQEKLSELLSAYLDNELEANERSLVDKLLREDAAARRLLAELRETAQLVASLPRHAAPASIAVDLQSRLERAALLGDANRFQINPPARRTRRWIACLSLAAMLGLAAFGVYWFSSQSLSNRKEQVAVSKGASEIDRKAVTGESANSATPSANSIKPVPLQPPLDLLLAQGAKPESVTNHTFDSEPVVLQVTAASEKELVAVANALTDSLRSQGVADLRSSSQKAKENHVSSDSAFFVSGKSGVNYQSPEQRQVLVHAPRSQVDAMFAALPKSETAPRDVQFRAGDMMANGVESSRRMLPIVQSQVPQNAPGTRVATRIHTKSAGESAESHSDSLDETAPVTSPGAKPQPATVAAGELASKKDASKGAYFGGLLKMFGLNPALLTPIEPKQATADSSRTESDQSTSHAAPPEPPSLVARGLNRLENDSTPHRENAKVARTDALQDKPKVAADQRIDDPPITVVVQIVPPNTDQNSSPTLKSEKPAASPTVPTGRTKSK